jgi:hypothetical protein
MTTATELIKYDVWGNIYFSLDKRQILKVVFSNTRRVFVANWIRKLKALKWLNALKKDLGHVLKRVQFKKSLTFEMTELDCLKRNYNNNLFIWMILRLSWS